MEEEMEELYDEEEATRDDPEPCVGVREGTGEASGWARAGRAIEPRNHRVVNGRIKWRTLVALFGVVELHARGGSTTTQVCELGKQRGDCPLRQTIRPRYAR
jgi:hypothetical protein